MTLPLFSLHDISDQYDTYIVDLWGVVHNGYRLSPGVQETFTRLQEHDKKILLLSNAPRRKAPVQRQLEELGLSSSSYTDLYTSGEDAHHALKSNESQKKCFSFMASDADLLADSKIVLTDDITKADFFLNARMPSMTDALIEGYLKKALEQELPMICVNPDVSVVAGGEVLFCAGSLAERYEALGGEVSYHGKPHPSIYKALQKRNVFDKSRTIAIGDALKTDILGAQNFGIDSILVLSGLEGKSFTLERGMFPEKNIFKKYCEEKGCQPTYLLTDISGSM